MEGTRYVMFSHMLIIVTGQGTRCTDLQLMNSDFMLTVP